jgi:hypothetical protein
MSKQATSEVIEPYMLSNDGLTQTSVRKIYFAHDMHKPTIVRVRTQLPPFVLPTYWNEYKLSQDDVVNKDKLFKKIPAQLLWLACLVHGIDVSAQCIKPSFAHTDEVLISRGTDALKLLISKTNHRFNNKRNVLDMESTASLEHIPPLPTCEVHESEIPRIANLLTHNLQAFEVCPVDGFYTLHGKQYLPVKLEGDAIFLQRATRYDNYLQSNKRQRFGYASVPVIAQTPNGELYALCEDGVLVTPKEQ